MNKFNDFWTWLRKKRSAETLVRAKPVHGHVQDDVLILTSSGGRKYRITRETAESYFREATQNNFEDLTGNKRWVAALIRKFFEN